MSPMLADPPAALPGSPRIDVAACGDVVCEVVAGRSALTMVRATDPLKLLTPNTHGHAKAVILSTYGGGMLGGDHVGLNILVKAGARLVVATQSTSKVYRTENLPSEQAITATVGDDALLAVLPDPLCAYADSRFHQRQSYTLAATGNLVWLDWLTSGRRARGERWAMSEIISRTEISVGGQTRLRETLALDDAAGEIGSPLRVGRFDCYAVLMMAGPMLGRVMESARSIIRSVDLSSSSPLLAADAALAGGAVFRILGQDVQSVQALLRRLLDPLTPLLGYTPWERKW